MRKQWFGAMVALTTVLGLALPAAADAPDRSESSWIVALVDGADPSAEAPGIAQRHGGRSGHIYEHALNGFQFLGSEQAASNLARNPRVRAVTPDGVVHAVAETVPTGVSRIEAPAAHATATGSGAVVAVIDTGIDLDHPDLAANIHPSLGKDCINNDFVADDDHGHGTHVAGTIAAIDNDLGVIGVAPAATLVPVKVLNASGSGSWSDVICGIDYVTANATVIKVANMSLGGSGSASNCGDGGMREAICTAVGVGLTFVVAAGNDSANASGFVPAAYPEALTVSAFSDTNGTQSNAGCSGWPFTTCDEVFASFSNYGSIVDVMAPGVGIYSTVIKRYGTKSGTSMAAPHVAGVAALSIAAGTATTPAQVEALLKRTGECPNGTTSGDDGSCAGQGTWTGDPDGVAEPLVNAARAVAGGGGGVDGVAPTVSIASPANDAAVSGTVLVTANAGDNVGVARVEFYLGTVLKATDTSDSYEWSWDTRTSTNGSSHTITAKAFDAAGNSSATSVTVTVNNTTTGITLSARGYKVKGVHHAELTWSGASSVDVYRGTQKLNESAVGGTTYTDNTGQKGSGTYNYKVCNAGTTTCSNEVTVVF